MPNVFQRIEAKSSIVGEDTTIRRALPSAQRRTIGAWCFLDHAGPVKFKEGKGLHVGPHPHIGLQTFTWMIEGEITHRDSLGNETVIRPGEVNLMTSGIGICHSEDSVEDGKPLHAAQLWIALPDHARHIDPAFEHIDDLPRIDKGGATVTVLAGEFEGQKSRATIHTPLVGLDITATDATTFEMPLRNDFEYGFLVLKGHAQVDAETIESGTLLYLQEGAESVALHLTSGSELLVVGGVPFDEKLLVWWNFVARTQEELEAAVHDWNNDVIRFPAVHGSPAQKLTAPELTGLKLRPRDRHGN